MEKRYLSRWVTPDEKARLDQHNAAIEDSLRPLEARVILFIGPKVLADRIVAGLNFLDHMDDESVTAFVGAFGP